MKAERWQKIRRICEDALERKGADRESFLAGACTGDEKLRAEVDSFMSGAVGKDGFIETPAIEIAAKGIIKHEVRDAVSDLTGEILLHYRITEKIGAGGMGEVYRATDTKLEREVAIKVLPEEFALNADRIARFQREAKLLASLNHPNIASIYGIEESTGTHFLVMELIEGQMLGDRIKSGPIPVEEALKLALQIAEALEAAHEKGVIHRDLKPANIKVTPDGKVKVLDFGLAKAFAGEQADLNLSNSPTLSVAATQQGVILGTAAYMSPEQARGKSVDKRADIWAFGCVFYEMLTGFVAFRGEDVGEILASVIKGDVNLILLPANLHPRVREAINRCLQKDLRRRYQGVADASYEIEQALANPNGILRHPVTTAQPRKRFRTILPLIAAALVIGLIIAGVWILKPSEPRRVRRLEYSLPEDQQLDNTGLPTLAISPDGMQLAYATAEGLYLRPLDDFNAKPIAGSGTNPSNPFFSPDGKRVGYAADSKLKTIDSRGGTPKPLCDVSNFRGGSWGTDDMIVYAEYLKGIYSISAKGGNPQMIVEGEFYTPQLLPDGKTLLFTSGPFPYKIMVQSLQSGEPQKLFDGDNARYISTGHIVYGEADNLVAVPFDLKTLKVTGKSFPVVNGIWRRNPEYATQYTISDAGTLIYIPSQKSIKTGSISQRWRAPAFGLRKLVWVDLKGNEVPIAVDPQIYSGPRISPDGKKVALTISTGNKSDIYILDIESEMKDRLTFNEKSSAPLWTPDGQYIFFLSEVDEKPVICRKAANGNGDDEIIGSVAELGAAIPFSWADEGKTLVTIDKLKEGNDGIGAITIEGSFKWKPLLAKEEYWLSVPAVSPHGLWMAYSSNESGQFEVYVLQYPELNNMRQVSYDGGIGSLWSADGQKLFYRKGDAVIAVEVRTEPTFSRENIETLFRGTYASLGFQEGHPWDIDPDGKRFLMMKPFGPAASAGEGPRKINIVLNWFEELKGKVPEY